MIERDPLQMALDEAVRHGASREDLSQLREYFRKRAVEKYQTPLIADDEDTHLAAQLDGK